MLDLVRAHTGLPEDVLCSLDTVGKTVLIYPSGDTVVLLNARSLVLERILALWEVFPSTFEVGRHISNVTVDSGLKLIAAYSGSLLAFWYPSGKLEDVWKVHSSLTLEDDINCLDCQAGLIAVATSRNLSIYSLSLQDDLPTWTRKMSKKIHNLSKISFSPSLTHLAAIPSNANKVYIISTATLNLTQSIQHPRQVKKTEWRPPQSPNRGDLVLYTVTADTTLRIFIPVLDSPTCLQLHAVLDINAFVPYSFRNPTLGASDVFWLNRSVMQESAALISAAGLEHGSQNGLKSIHNGEWDLFVQITSDQSMIARAIASIDSRPPTLLKQFTVLHHSKFGHFPPRHLLVSQFESITHEHTLTMTTYPPLTSFELNPHLLFDPREGGLKEVVSLPPEIDSSFTKTRIIGLQRTADCCEVIIKRLNCVQFCTTDGQTLKLSFESALVNEIVVLRGGGSITSFGTADSNLVLYTGKAYVTYSHLEGCITLKAADGITITALQVPALASLFALPESSAETTIIGVTVTSSLLRIAVGASELTILDQSTLSLSEPPLLLLPIEKMTEPHGTDDALRDIILSASVSGELSFWRPGKQQGWICTGKVDTGRRDIRIARCSPGKKTVIVSKDTNCEELSIWDSKTSEFSTGLEYQQRFAPEERVISVDWTNTDESYPILAVGFLHAVHLLSQHRMTYFDQEPAWRVCYKIDLSVLTPNPLSDCVWLINGSLLISSSHQTFLYAQPNFSSIISEGGPVSSELFTYVSKQNRPLPDYHPQMLLQCLLWGKVDLTKEVIVRLARAMGEYCRYNGRQPLQLDPLDAEMFWENEIVAPSKHSVHVVERYNTLWSESWRDAEDEPTIFTRKTVTTLMKRLEESSQLDLNPNELAHLLILIQTVLEIDEQRRALDDNGLRYLISLRSFYILNERAAPKSNGELSRAVPVELVARDRIRYRDIVWAYHSESQDLLLEAASTGGKNVLWSDARALGIFMWLKSYDSLKAQMENIARNQYMSGDLRDPTACSLFYFALGKVKLVHGLWKQAAWHKEQQVMLKFLSNDFEQPRWRTAALKNAYALLGKQRAEYAAAFFLLGGSLRDAVNVCLRQLNDFQLAIALARIVEHTDDGPVFQEVLRTVVVPLAFKEGNRWLGSWSFWCLRRRDLAVRILITPLRDLASSLDVIVTEIGDPHYDDPSLALLFSQLKSKSLQTVKGMSEISGRTEVRFLMQMVRVFCRMGCHVLALALARSWSFERPDMFQAASIASRQIQEISSNSRTVKRGLSRPVPQIPHIRRRSSILIDMAIPSFPPTRAASPTQKRGSSPIPELPPHSESPDAEARYAGLGNLLKTAKRDIEVPEFNMNDFYSPAHTPPKPSTPIGTTPENHVDHKTVKTAGLGSFMKSVKNVQVPEFDMDNFF